MKIYRVIERGSYIDFNTNEEKTGAIRTYYYIFNDDNKKISVENGLKRILDDFNDSNIIKYSIKDNFKGEFIHNYISGIEFIGNCSTLLYQLLEEYNYCISEVGNGYIKVTDFDKNKSETIEKTELEWVNYFIKDYSNKISHMESENLYRILGLLYTEKGKLLNQRGVISNE